MCNHISILYQRFQSRTAHLYHICPTTEKDMKLLKCIKEQYQFILRYQEVTPLQKGTCCINRSRRLYS